MFNCGDGSLINCMFHHNTASVSGGGMWNEGDIEPALINCTFSLNTAQQGGGMYNTDQSTPIVTNGILWRDTPDEISDALGALSKVTYSCIKGGWPGTGNIEVDPLFIDLGTGDLHIRYTSPCRDAGDDSATLDPEDFEGDPRIAYGAVDMGADEFHTHLYSMGEAAPGLWIDIRIVGLPLRPTLLCLGTDIIDPPLPTIYGDWYLKFPILLMEPGATSWEGLVELSARIPPSYPAPSMVPLQAFVRDELTNLCLLKIEAR
jgi:hypothetical protein